MPELKNQSKTWKYAFRNLRFVLHLLVIALAICIKKTQAFTSWFFAYASRKMSLRPEAWCSGFGVLKMSLRPSGVTIG